MIYAVGFSKQLLWQLQNLDPRFKTQTRSIDTPMRPPGRSTTTRAQAHGGAHSSSGAQEPGAGSTAHYVSVGGKVSPSHGFALTNATLGVTKVNRR